MPYCCSIAKSCPTLCTSMDSSASFPVPHHLPESAQVMSTESLMATTINALLCSIFPTSRLLRLKMSTHCNCSNEIPELQVIFYLSIIPPCRGASPRVTPCVHQAECSVYPNNNKWMAWMIWTFLKANFKGCGTKYHMI